MMLQDILFPHHKTTNLQVTAQFPTLPQPGADVALRNSALSACGRQGHWRTVMLQVAGRVWDGPLVVSL